MYNEDEDHVQTVDEARRTMETYHPVTHSGVSEEQWQELAQQHRDALTFWLTRLQHWIRSGNQIIPELTGSPLRATPTQSRLQLGHCGGSTRSCLVDPAGRRNNVRLDSGPKYRLARHGCV